MSGTPYPGLERVSDPAVKAVLKAVFDKIGNVETQAAAIGTVSQPLTTHLDASGNQLQAVADPTHPQDAVTLKYLQHYVESRVTTVVAAATAPATPTPPSDGPVIPTPTPAPPPTPSGPATTGTFLTTDMITIGVVGVENSAPDIATWAQTATLSNFSFQNTGVAVTFDKQSGAGRWPDVPTDTAGDSIQYTLWIFLNIHGAWYGSGVIEYWFGLGSNGGPPSGVAANWYYDPIRWPVMAGYQPAVGETVGFMVSAGQQRNNGPTIVKERSQIITIPFPSNNGAVYT